MSDDILAAFIIGVIVSFAFWIITFFSCDSLTIFDYPDYVKVRLYRSGYADFKLDEYAHRYWELKDTVLIEQKETKEN